MTDNEIIKAFERCMEGAFEKCEECPLRVPEKEDIFTCLSKKQELTLDLLNRQKAEIEKLQRKILMLYPKGSPCSMQVEVSDRLEREIKSEAIKEFARGTIRWCNVKLHKKSHSLSGKYMDGYKDGIMAVMSYLHNVKEMTGVE